MQTPQFILGLNDELVVDEFACGGGMSEAIEQAIGRHVDISVNHDDDACSMHQANHPQTEHFCADVFDVPPRKVTRGRPVGLLHMSPDCTHHSQARGGQPRDRKLRALSWIGVKWAGQEPPRIITGENVKQLLQWGPLIAKRDKQTGRVLRLDGTVAAAGERVPLEQQYLVPDPKRAGQTWDRFVAILKSLGYDVEWFTLCAADYGVPTTRTRLFFVARRDGAPIVRPTPTHFKNPMRGQKKWRGAHECIDWSIPSKSIFDRPKPLADATLRRVAQGLKRYVLDSGDPFIVPIANWSRDSIDSIRAPLRTVTAWPRGGSLALVTAFVEQANGGFNETFGRDAREPFSTTTSTGSQQRLVTAHLAHLRGNCDARSLDDPLMTISAGGQHHALVEYHLSREAEDGALRCAAFLMQYYSEGGQWSDLRAPMNTITTKDRLALVTVWIKGDPYVVVDICLRMLTPRELYNANGFPATYIIDRGHDGRIFSKATQVRMCGNAVPPPLGKAVIAAQWNSLPSIKEAA
jgi:DNA (cytosine-5)-methyltransferase 1